ncbi:transketolase [Streptomyces sp. OE57]|uniref:transketolase n=1 Tax=Streptomyces lacaronensis TaxID=3379885 RepID=UPI0039B74944
MTSTKKRGHPSTGTTDERTLTPPDGETLAFLSETAREIRSTILELAAKCPVHLGAALSVTDVLTALYFRRMHFDPANPESPERDRLILSKGHSAFALYAVLGKLGMISTEEFESVGSPDQRLCCHPTENVTGIELATGALGHGLSVAAGIALAAELDGRDHRTVTILGDGELNEGSVWEAAMFAASQRLGSLVAIIDRNGYQQEGPTESVLRLEPIDEKWRAFGWQVLSIDGHDFQQLCTALDTAYSGSEIPTLLIAHTTKGHGVSFIAEDPVAWHMGRLTEPELRKALREIQTDGSQTSTERPI